MTASAHTPLAPIGAQLRRLYAIRFGFAVVWSVLLVLASGAVGPLLTVLLVLYPLVDAVAVIWQLRSEGRGQASRVPEIVNVVLSLLAAIALGWASVTSFSTVLAVWGIWAITSGAAQLVTALLRRRSGGQVPLIISGAISIAAGAAFASQSAHEVASIAGIAGYSAFGGIFFLIAAVRLTVLLRRAS